MLQTKEILTAVGTLACAVGVGFIMQSSETAEQRYGKSKNTPATTVGTVLETESISQIPDTNAFLEVQQITLTSAQSDNPKIVLPEDPEIQVVSASPEILEAPTPDIAVPYLNCEITAQSAAAKAAMINLNLNAPCLPSERVTIHHRGMQFTETTDADGTLKTTVPALDKHALVIFAFSNGDGVVTQLQVPEVGQYDRSVIQWKGDAGFEMHAREFGADYGDPGHVWKDAARDPSAIDNAQGFLTRLGNADVAESLMAEVYTFPTAMSSQPVRVDLSIEAEVTAKNCGLEIEAQSLEMMDGDVKTQNLTLAVPDCDAKGSFLVLNNLVEDLKVASN